MVVTTSTLQGNSYGKYHAIIIVHSCSVNPRRLCLGVKYYIVHMYSMPYYTYNSTANFLVLGPTALMYISKERCCDEDLHGVGIFFKLNE